MQPAFGEMENAAEPEANHALPSVLDESAVLALDNAAQSSALDIDLLRTAPVHDVRIRIEAMVALLQKMDHRKLLSKQGPLSRLTGADVEARLEFELAGQKVMKSVSLLRQAAQNGQSVSILLKQALADIEIEQTRLEHVIFEAKALLNTPHDADEFVIGRFERRLSSMMAMHAANMLTVQQLALAENVLQGLLDRVTDVETLLLPLWQRNTLAFAHASIGRPQRQAAHEFIQTHNQLINYLKQKDVA